MLIVGRWILLEYLQSLAHIAIRRRNLWNGGCDFVNSLSVLLCQCLYILLFIACLDERRHVAAVF